MKFQWQAVGPHIYRDFVTKNGVIIKQWVGKAAQSTFVRGKYIKHPPATVIKHARMMAAVPELIAIAEALVDHNESDLCPSLRDKRQLAIAILENIGINKSR